MNEQGMPDSSKQAADADALTEGLEIPALEELRATRSERRQRRKERNARMRERLDESRRILESMRRQAGLDR